MTLTIDLPDEVEEALKAMAQAQGVSVAGYARRVLVRAVAVAPEIEESGPPLETGRGMLAKYGSAPSGEEIDANRADMFRRFAEDFR